MPTEHHFFLETRNLNFPLFDGDTEMLVSTDSGQSVFNVVGCARPLPRRLKRLAFCVIVLPFSEAVTSSAPGFSASADRAASVVSLDVRLNSAMVDSAVLNSVVGVSDVVDSA